MNRQLDFNDVLIRPRPSDIRSRKEVNLERNFSYKYSYYSTYSLPLIAANMDTVGTINVMKELCQHKIITALNKFITLEEFQEEAEFLTSNVDLFTVSIGFSDDEINRLKEINKIIPFKMICIDVANGYMNDFVAFCAKVRETFPEKIIIAGNVVCKLMTRKLILEGKVDVVKIGIGSGSACTTRIKTGVGRPQFSTVKECSDEASLLGAMVISDGGITCPGDVAKALGGGAHMVMIGGQFAGHDQNPGEIFEENGKKFKLFYGMSSSHAMNKNYGGVNKYRTSEGRCIRIPYKGNLRETVEDYLGGLRSTCAYINCKDIKDIFAKAEFYSVGQQFNSSLL